MKLADKIVSLRKSRGWSQEELAEQIEVTRQSVSKWESGLSVPDLDKIVALAALFDVSCDYLLKEDGATDAPATNEPEKEEPTPKKILPQEEANAYLETRRVAAPRIALGVLLCILGAAALVLTTAIAEHSRLPELTGVLIGLGILLTCVCIGVALFISSGVRLSAYSYLENEPFALPSSLASSLKSEQEGARPRFIRYLITGVSLCILSLVPLFVMLALADERSPLYTVQIATGVAGLLLFVAVGVFLIVFAAMRFGGYAVLLQEGEYAEVKKQAKKKSEAAQGIFWLVVVAVYLGYSFATNDWDRSWIVWPVAALLSGVIEHIFIATDKK
jgi:transcriptional regulator with XRE-family HTH domain